MTSHPSETRHLGVESRTAEMRTAVELWERRVADSASARAFRFKVVGVDGGWKTLSWSEMDVLAREIAAGLVSLGVAVGDRVCIISQTRVEWVACDVGIMLAGAVSVPVYPTSTSEQSAFIIRDAGATLVITEDRVQLAKVLAAGARTPSVRAYVCLVDDAEGAPSGAEGRAPEAIDRARGKDDPLVCSLEALRTSGRKLAITDPAAVGRARTAALGPDSPFTCIYTSGTTGNPKGVILSHENLTSAIASSCRAMTLFDDDDQLLFLPLAHVLGRELVWVSVQAGLLTTFAESVARLKENLVETRPTYMVGVPRVFEKFFSGVQIALAQGSAVKRGIGAWALRVARDITAAHQSQRPVGAWLAVRRWLAERLVFSRLRMRLGLDRCRFLVSGGAPLAAEIAQFFHGVGILILEGYGLTETVGAAFLNRLDRFRFGTVGSAFDIVETKIADDGEILFRGRSIFRGYHDNPTATAEAIDAEGWFHSGDVGQFEDGFLRITDRKKDLIVTAGGKKVAPQPLENALKGIPWVSQAVVYGDRRPYCVALVTLSDEALRKFGSFGNLASNGALAVGGPAYAAIGAQIARLNSTLAPYETIKEFAILPQDFTEAEGEMTPSLKVRRKVVIEKYRAIIDGLYRAPHAD